MQENKYNNENVVKLKISQDVIITIVNQSAIEIPGVHAISKTPIDIKGYLTQKPQYAGILVNLSDDVAVIDVAIIIESGYQINDVAQKVQKNIKEAIQTMTGVAVSKVNVIIEGIHFSDKQ